MQYVTFSKSALAVTAVLTLSIGAFGAGCADSAEVPADDTGPTEPAPAPETKLPASTPATTPPEKTCAPSCQTDSDCASSCPALAGGVQCCDTKTNTCWGSKTSSCPKPVETPDAGDPPPAY